MRSIEILLRQVQNLKRIGPPYAAQDRGTLSIATTHTQARCVLPAAVARLRQSDPKVTIGLHPGSPDTVVRVPLVPGTFRPDFERLAAALGPRTQASMGWRPIWPIRRRTWG